MTDLEYIRMQVPIGEALTQLAEEAAELSQAALKLRRALPHNANPTPVTMAEAREKLNEEVADVLLCIQVAEGMIDNGKVRRISKTKAHRWAVRVAN